MKRVLRDFYMLIVCMLCSISALAQEIGGVNYLLDPTSMTGRVCQMSSGSYAGHVRIPSKITYGGKEYTVTGIGSDAFKDCRNLSAVTIPQTVTFIGYYAFWGCINLGNIYCYATTPSKL